MSNKSISQQVAEFATAAKNYLAILEAFNKLAISNDETIQVEFHNADGSISNYELPSNGYILSELKRISNNLDNLLGTNGDTNIVLSDGTVANALRFQVPNVPEPIVIDQEQTTFEPQFNNIPDLLLDPSLVITVDVSDQTTVNDTHLLVNRVIISPDSDNQMSIMDNNVIGVDFSYSDLINTLVNAGIPYVERESKIAINNRSANLYGKFSVLSITTRELGIITNGSLVTAPRQVYKLNTLKYTNTSTGAEGYLKAGDVLYLIPENGGTPDTDYRITYVDISSNEVVVKINNGGNPPRIGTNVFGISPQNTYEASISVPVYPNEYMAVYMKRVNPATNIQAAEWGSTKPIFVNNLLYGDQTILEYYNSFVTDFRNALLSLNQQGISPIVPDLTPNVPVIDAGDFRVDRINTHRTSTVEAEEVNSLISDTQSLKSEIQSLDKEIRTLNTKLRSPSGLLSERDANKINKEIQTVSSKKSEKISRLKTTVDAAVAKAATDDVTPKYRIRGFWNIPAPINNNGRLIQIISFDYRYRYLRPDETTSTNSQFKVTSNNKKMTANFSNWVVVNNPTRARSANDDGSYSWDDEDLLGEDININQLDIPISSNEKVEIQVRSVSELGYPGSPLKSDWSDSTIIEFPSSLKSTNTGIISKVEKEASLADLMDYLSSEGILLHVGNSIYVNDQYFAHDTSTISTPFSTPENQPKDLSTLLIEFNNSIELLKASITGDTGEMRVSILNSQNEVVTVVNNSDTVELFSGYYLDQVSQLPVSKGAIITQNYSILIENLSQADLELLGYIPGSPDSKLPSSSSYDGYLFDIYEYFNYRRHWEAPIIFNNNTRDDLLLAHHNNNNGPYRQTNGYQSSQHRSQYLNIRARDLSLNTKLFQLPSNTSDHVLTINTSGADTSYVWDLTQSVGAVNGDGKLSKFCVHVDHPYLVTGSYFMDNFNTLFNSNRVPTANVVDNSILYPAFYHSRYFNLKATDTDGLSQLGYYQYQKVGTDPATFDNFPRKYGFIPEDRYLIGSDTVGSYLFLEVPSNEYMYTGSNIYNVGKIIKNGDTYSLKIPFVFQYRMTDYNGPSNTGNGTLGGYGSPSIKNITYSKKMGIDILTGERSLFSFDIKCTAKFKPDNSGNSEGFTNG